MNDPTACCWSGAIPTGFTQLLTNVLGKMESAKRGLDIGLALARKIAVLHGGALNVFNEGRDKGSEFTLRISLASVRC